MWEQVWPEEKLSKGSKDVGGKEMEEELNMQRNFPSEIGGGVKWVAGNMLSFIIFVFVIQRKRIKKNS